MHHNIEKALPSSALLSARERIDIDFADAIPGIPVKLGRVNYTKAHRPLEPHTHHGCMEFVYVVRGRQFYTADGVEYTVTSGEMFFTRPDERHSSSGVPEEKALFYYLVVDVGALCEGFIGCNKAEGEAIRDELYGIKRRVFRGRPDVKRLLDGMLTCYFNGGAIRVTMLRNHLSNFLLGVIESGEKCTGAAGPDPMRRVLEHIEKNVSEDIGLPTLAKIAGLSLPRFKSSFRKQLGVPPREYVLRRKVDAAKEMLASTSLSITDIAYLLQFSSSQYFATVFKRFAFVSPSEFRGRVKALDMPKE
jgi:AraC-like DNA-binding protein